MVALWWLVQQSGLAVCRSLSDAQDVDQHSRLHRLQRFLQTWWESHIAPSTCLLALLKEEYLELKFLENEQVDGDKL